MDSVPAGTREAEVAEGAEVTGVVNVDEGKIRSVAAATCGPRWS